MSVAANEDLRYPIGRLHRPASLTPAERAEAVQTLRNLPDALAASLEGLTGQQIQTPYREGGWNIRQVVHHLADSHMQAYSRLRMALTEDWPIIKPYNEAAWAELADSKSVHVEISLDILRPLHARWVVLIESIPEADFTARGFTHPEHGRTNLDQALATYAWHSLHHTAHITKLRERMGW
jgi:hypothetical protein